MLTNGQLCYIAGAGKMQDQIIGYYQNLYVGMFPADREKALELGLKTGALIGSQTEKQIERLTNAGLDITHLVDALLKRYQY